MAKKRYTPEAIIHKLREVEILQGQGKTVAQAVKQTGVTEQTEPPRVYRRLHFLRGWSYEQVNEIFAGSSRSGCTVGV